MAILKVARLGHPVLRKKAAQIDIEKIPSEEIQHLINDMIETMREHDGIGLAAPQVHHSIRIAIIESTNNPRYPEAPDIPLLVLVNPEFTYMSDEMIEGWESCLSVNDLRGRVSRSKDVKVSAYDRMGGGIILDASGFIATVFQHEIDHLDGIVYLDRMKDMKSLAHMKEFEKYCLQKKDSSS